MKANATRCARCGGKILAGFAGAAADAFTLFESSRRSWSVPVEPAPCAVELAKDWRSDACSAARALLVVADKEHGFVVSGSGELIEPDDGVLAIGSAGRSPSPRAALLSSTR